MARIYGGILGLLAMTTALLRGLIHAQGVEATLWTAWTALWCFAAVGFVVGGLAERMIVEAVAQRLAGELAQRQSERRAAG